MNKSDPSLHRKATRGSLAATALLALLASACGGGPPIAESPAPEAPASAAVERATATRFDIDSSASRIHILVYRAGALARLGHNHVITVRDIEGTVWHEDAAGRSAFELSFPVERLVVDDPAARDEAGDDFPGRIPAEDIEATRENMLSERVLHADAFPRISLRSTRMAEQTRPGQVTVEIELRDQRCVVAFPVAVRTEGERLFAHGEATVTHEQLGLEPFSVMMGALSVAEEIGISYRIEARQRPD